MVTAGLKIHGLWVDPYGQENFLALPWLQWLTIEVEVLLGLWLLSGVANRMALIVSLAVFTIFAALSFTLAWQGQADCGCFGKVKVNPWYTFGLDLVVIAVVAVTLWRTQSVEGLSKGQLSGFLMNCLQVTVIAAVLLGVMATGLTIYAGDPWIGLAKLRGETLVLTPSVTELGDGLAGEKRAVEISVHNSSNKTISIFGATTSCSCIASGSLPITLAPGEAGKMHLHIKFTGSSGVFNHSYLLYTNTASVYFVARFTGKVVDKPKPE